MCHAHTSKDFTPFPVTFSKGHIIIMHIPNVEQHPVSAEGRSPGTVYADYMLLCYVLTWQDGRHLSAVGEFSNLPLF